jgi:hypothetical protein
MSIRDFHTLPQRNLKITFVTRFRFQGHQYWMCLKGGVA